MANIIIPDYKYDNYYVFNGYAYTEDHIRVRKLFVYNIPRKTTLNKVWEHFFLYGHIKSVRFVGNEGPKHPITAIVHFGRPIDATRTLFFYHSSPDRSVFKKYDIKVCNSWSQPKEILRRKCDYSHENLNDDSLECIMRILPLSYQLVFARSSLKIREVFHRTSKISYRKVFLESLVNLSQWDIRTFFHFAGDNIIHIEGTLPKGNQQHILKFMNMFCINLEVLDMDSSDEHHSGNGPLLQILWKQKKLKTLKLSKSFVVSGKHLRSLSPTIESISAYCIDVKEKHILFLCRSMSNLKELNLGKIVYIFYDVVHAIGAVCQNLESMSIGIHCFDYGLIGKLPKLKNLTVFVPKRPSYCPLLFAELIENKSDQLEFLRIDGGNGVDDSIALQISQLKALRTLHCSFSDHLTDLGLNCWSYLEHLEEIDLRCCVSITKTALINLLLKCKKLIRVNLQCCILKNDLIIELIQKMQEQINKNTFMRTGPLFMKAGCTNISKDILNSQEYKQSTHLIILDLRNPHFFFD